MTSAFHHPTIVVRCKQATNCPNTFFQKKTISKRISPNFWIADWYYAIGTHCFHREQTTGKPNKNLRQRLKILISSPQIPDATHHWQNPRHPPGHFRSHPLGQVNIHLKQTNYFEIKKRHWVVQFLRDGLRDGLGKMTHRWSAPQWMKGWTQVHVFLWQCEARSVHGGEGIMTTPLTFRLQKVKKKEDTRHNLKKI